MPNHNLTTWDWTFDRNRCFIKKDAGWLHVELPAHYYPKRRIESTLRRKRMAPPKMSLQGERLITSFPTTTARSSESSARSFYTSLNGLEHVGAEDSIVYQPASDPLISCVVLLTVNVDFFNSLLLPSIVEYSDPHPIEVIVVCNGPASSLDLRVPTAHTSEFGCVSKGYNTGVHHARGEYIALFHDDCLVEDEEWIPKCLQALESRHAVTPEVHNSGGLAVAKAVPLVMRRDDYLAVGGFDERYYFGAEDIDFTYALLHSGFRVGRVDIKYRHFNGMSSVLMFGPDRATFTELFGYMAVPHESIREMQQACVEMLHMNPRFRRRLDADRLYFLDKYLAYFKGDPRADVLRKRRAQLEATLAGGPDPRNERENLVNYNQKRYGSDDVASSEGTS